MSHLLFQQVVFSVFAAITVFSALMVVTLNNPVRCVLFLVVAFISSAGMWIMAYAEFLALILVLVYVGAVMTLFLFVVMMINVDVESMKRRFWRYLPFGFIVLAVFIGLMMKVIQPDAFAKPQVLPPTDLSNTEQLGMVLYTNYAYAFILASTLLLIAIISAIALAHRGPRARKKQDLLQQLTTERSKRVRLVSMPSENNDTE